MAAAKVFAITVAAVVAAVAQAGTVDGTMKLTLLPANQSAVCLDGSPAGYYFRRSPGGAHADDWIFYFQGGGWCETLESCVYRSRERLGSSKPWPQVASYGGILSANDSINPFFHDWNVVYLPYCDGASFSGNVEQPVVVHDVALHFRGHRILEAIVTAALELGMASAEHVLVTGCSAGGLSTYLHADYVQSRVAAKTVAVPFSGFFLNFPNAEGQYIYGSEIKAVFEMQNATYGVDPDCIKDHSASDAWNCLFAPTAINYVDVPLFVVNSRYDRWQMENIVGKNVSSWANCSAHGPLPCTSDQISLATKFANTMVSELAQSPTMSKPGSGQFVYSCWTHCASEGDEYYRSVSVDGVTMRDAIQQWFTATTASPSWTDCTYTSNHCCNPSCTPAA